MPAFGPILLDESLWPLLVVRYKGRATIEQFAEMLAERSRYLDRNERYLVLNDLSHVRHTGSGEQRQLQVDWMKKEGERMRQWVVGVATVTDSAPLRLLLSIIQYFQPLPMPHIIVPRMSEAIPWIVSQMRQSGLEAGADLVIEHFGLNSGRRSG
jgi:hypothetical protein